MNVGDRVRFLRDHREICRQCRCGFAKAPIADSARIALQDDLRLHDVEFLESQDAAEKRAQVDFRRKAFDADHLRVAAPGRIGEAQVRHLYRQGIAPSDPERADGQAPVERPRRVLLDQRPHADRSDKNDPTNDNQHGGAEQSKENNRHAFASGEAGSGGWRRSRHRCAADVIAYIHSLGLPLNSSSREPCSVKPILERVALISINGQTLSWLRLSGRSWRCVGWARILSYYSGKHFVAWQGRGRQFNSAPRRRIGAFAAGL